MNQKTNYRQVLLGIVLTVPTGAIGTCGAQEYESALGVPWIVAYAVGVAALAATLVVVTRHFGRRNARALERAQQDERTKRLASEVTRDEALRLGLAEDALKLMRSSVASDRRNGYNKAGEVIAAKDLAAYGMLRDYLRHEAQNVANAYRDRELAIRRLIQAADLGGLHESLAREWFSDPTLPEFFSSLLSGVFSRRVDLAPLVAQLEQFPFPVSEIARSGEGNVASPGYRVGQAFASIRDALVHDRSPLPDGMAARLLLLCGRYGDVPYVSALRREIIEQLQ